MQSLEYTPLSYFLNSPLNEVGTQCICNYVRHLYGTERCTLGNDWSRKLCLVYSNSPSAEVNGVFCEANCNAAMISALVAKSFTDHTFFSGVQVVVERPVDVEGTSEEAGFLYSQKNFRNSPWFYFSCNQLLRCLFPCMLLQCTNPYVYNINVLEAKLATCNELILPDTPEAKQLIATVSLV